MGKSRGPYEAEYPVGSTVRIASREALEHFRSTWQLHHPLETEQLDFAGRAARVKAVGFYHGADELYTLHGVPGTWHEQHLLLEALPQRSRGAAAGIGFLAALGTAAVLYFGLMLLGGLTGVVAMCPSAPEWWAFTFFGLLLVTPIAGGIFAGIRVGGWYRQRG